MISLPKNLAIAFIISFLSTIVSSQTGQLAGLIYEGEEKEPIMFATVQVPNSGTGNTSDLDGNYVLELKPGVYQIEFSSIGYVTQLVDSVEIKAGATTRLDVELKVATEMLQQVEVVVSPLSRKEASPLSLRTIRANEIQYGAGSSGDISLLIQGMPGITFPPGFSNAINIRGGSSSENRFFVDDVEIPMLNHFAKQGTSGGVRSIINMNLLKKVDVYTSGFPADKGNATSGILDFQFKEGHPEKFSGIIEAGIIDFGLTLNGPLGQKANYNFSLRRSYTAWVLEILGQPFIGVYDDWNYKVKWNLHENHKITLIGLGAYDKGRANENPKDTPINRYIIDQMRPTTQWNTVNAIKYTNFRNQHYSHVILAHYLLEDNTKRYLFQDNSDPANLIEDYQSKEGELRLTVKNVQRYNDLKVAFGGEFGRVSYHTDAFFNSIIGDELVPFNYLSDLSFNKWGAYFNVSQRLLNRFMLLTIGARVDANDYSSSMSQPWKQFSPRFSIAYAINSQVTFNFNTGIYYQMPSGLTLSFRDRLGHLVNQSDEVKYFSATHFVGGMEWEQPSTKSKINIEGFFKQYKNYPFSIADQVVLLNKDFDLMRANNEAVSSTGEGQTYGLEFLYEQKNLNDFYGKLSYTLAWSRFKDEKGIDQPSVFDIRHAVTLSGGKHFGNGWHFGIKMVFQSPKPFTPYDFEKSSLISSWQGSQAFNIPDYRLLNSERMDPIFEINIRIDKDIVLKKWDMTIFVDILNVLDAQPAESPFVAVKKDANGQPLINPNNPLAYETFWLDREVSTLFPSAGIIAKF